MPRKNFAFRFAWFEAIAHLSWEVRLEVIEATIRYAETGETGQLSPAAAEAFEKYIMPDFHRRAKAAEYRARRKARLAAKDAAEAARHAHLAAIPLPITDFPLAIECPMTLYRHEIDGPPVEFIRQILKKGRLRTSG